MNLHTRGWGLAAVAAFAFVAMLAIGAMAGCDQILGINSNRYVDASTDDGGTGMPDTGSRDTGMGLHDAAAEASPWDCLGDPALMYQPGATTQLTLLTIDSLQPILQAEKVDGGSGLDILQYTPIPGLVIHACDSLFDPGCHDSTSMTWQPQTSDDAGVVHFTVPQDFAGFFNISSPSGPSLFTTTFFPSPFVPGETTNTLPATLLTQTATQGLNAVLSNVTIDYATDGGLGSVVMSIFDCHDHFADGVSFQPSAAAPQSSGYTTTIFYTEGMGQMEFPTTSTQATDKAGAGGILNVPIGSFSVKLVLAATGQPIGVVNLFINPGVASSVLFRTRTTRSGP
jgi:hypothetical protein